MPPHTENLEKLTEYGIFLQLRGCQHGAWCPSLCAGSTGQVATRQNAINELKRASIVMRAESYRRRLFSEFDRAKEMFLP